MLASLGRSPKSPALLSHPSPRTTLPSRSRTKPHKYHGCHTALAQLVTAFRCVLRVISGAAPRAGVHTCVSRTRQNGSLASLGSGWASADLQGFWGTITQARLRRLQAADQPPSRAAFPSAPTVLPEASKEQAGPPRAGEGITASAAALPLVQGDSGEVLAPLRPLCLHMKRNVGLDWDCPALLPEGLWPRCGLEVYHN